MGPCHSCRSVIKDFRRGFPALTLRIRYRNALRGGSSAALIPAGDGLYGQYGIGDATQRADQLWAKTYPGNPVAAAAGTFDVKVTGPGGRRFTGTVRGIGQQPTPRTCARHRLRPRLRSTRWLLSWTGSPRTSAPRWCPSG